MVKDEQVFRLRQLLRPSTTLKEIALQASMALCAYNRETPTLPVITVEGGEGNER